MKSQIKNLVLVASFVLIAIHNVSSLKCYLCVSYIHPTCINGHNTNLQSSTTNLLDAFLVECQNPPTPLEANMTVACRTRQQNDESGKLMHVARSCAVLPKADLTSKDCSKGDPTPVASDEQIKGKATCDFCGADGCNGKPI